jgi:3-dehydroquinate dehydratase-2
LAEKKVHRILLLQGANMSYLGRRQPEIYGTVSAAQLDAMLQEHARAKRFELEIFYTHLEGEAIARLYRAVDEGFDGLVMNPAGFTHAGHALRDCVSTLPFPYVEVHMTNIAKRGLVSAVAPTAVGTIAGFGLHSYLLGLDAVLQLLDAGR